LNIWTQRVKLEAKPNPADLSSDTGKQMGSGPYRYNVTKTGYCELIDPVSRIFFLHLSFFCIHYFTSIVTHPHHYRLCRSRPPYRRSPNHFKYHVQYLHWCGGVRKCI
jgi:hypothetical protein